MLIKHIIPLLESLSPVVYYFRRVESAKNIMTTGQFQLSSSIGSVESKYAPKGYPYFLSTTRTRHGGYHDAVVWQGVLFVLDGQWYNQRYPSSSVDYWSNRDPMQSHHRRHEAEDRIFSREPTMPADGIRAVHVYVNPDAEPHLHAAARQLLIAAKTKQIPAFFYNDVKAWRNFDTRHQADVRTLKGQERTGGRTSRHPGYLRPWIELIRSPNREQLSKEADEIRYGMMYNPYRVKDVVAGLNNSLNNARKPDAGPDRGHAVAIIKYMRDHKLNSVDQLVQHLADRWQAQDNTLTHA